MLCHRYVDWRSVSSLILQQSLDLLAPMHSAARTIHPAASGYAREGKFFGRPRKGAISQLCRGLWGDREGMTSHSCDCSLQPLRLLSCSAPWSWPPATYETSSYKIGNSQAPMTWCVVTDVHAWPCGREVIWCHCDVTVTNFNLQNIYNWRNKLV